MSTCRLLLLLAGLLARAATADAAPPGCNDGRFLLRQEDGQLIVGAAGRDAITVADGRIAAIGKVAGTGLREIDASGDYVSPGWIDMMDQSGGVLRKNGLAESKLRQGLTTLVAGEGGTPVPAAEIATYFNQLESQGIALNFASYYSAAQARVEVMGDKAGTPSPSQIAAMQDKVRTAELVKAAKIQLE